MQTWFEVYQGRGGFIITMCWVVYFA